MITLPNGQNPLAGPESAVPGAAPQLDTPSLGAGADALTGNPAPAARDFRSQLAGAADKLDIPLPGQQPAQLQGHVAKFAAGADEAAKQNPNPSAPGAWAKNLLSGVMSSLGDASHATDKPGGALTGITNTLAARSQRLAGEKQQQFENNLKMTREQRETENSRVANALTEAQTLNLGITRSKLMLENDEAAQKLRDATDAHAQLSIDAYKKSHHDVEEGVSTGDLQNRMSTFAKNPPLGPDGKPQQFSDVYTVVPKGDEQVLGPDGQKHMQQTVAIVKKTANPVDISPALHDFLDEYLPKGQAPPAGTQMPGPAFDSQMTQASQVAAATAQIDNFMGEKMKVEKDRNLQNALVTASHFMAADVNDPFVGLEQGQQQAQQHIDQGKSQLELAQKAGDPDKVAQAQQYLTQAQKEKADLDTVINSPTLAAAREKHWEIQTKADEKKTAKAEEDAAVDGSRIAEGLDFPSDLSKRSKSLEALKGKADAYSLQKYGHPVNWGVLEQDYKQAEKKTTQDTMSLIRSVGEQGGSLDIAMNAAKGLPNVTDSQTVNKIFSKAGGEFGNQAVSDFHTAMYGLADEYAKIVGGGTASDTGFANAMNILKQGYTTGQMDGAAAILRRDMAARERGLINNNIFMIRKWVPGAEGNAKAEMVLRGQDPWKAEKEAGAYTSATNPAASSGGQQKTAGSQATKSIYPAGATKRVQGPDGKMHYTNDDGTEDYGVIH